MTTDVNGNTNTPGAAPNASPVATLISMFIEPVKAFAAVRANGMVWFPLALTIIGTAAMLFFYYQQVDIAWLQDKMLAGKEMEPAAREAAIKFMGRGTLQGMGVGGAAIGAPIMIALIALYFLLVGKFMDVQATYGKFFTMVAWAGMPGLLAIVLGFVQIVLADHGQLAPNQLNPLSVNQLIFHLDMTARWASVLDAINVTNIWSIVLAGIGFQGLGARSRVTSIIVAAVPLLIVLLISAAYQGAR